MSLKEKVTEMLKAAEDDVQPSEYNNLILDEMEIEALSADDKAFLGEFTSLETLAMNGTSLRSLENLPANENLTRLELAENKLGGDELKHLLQYAGSLHTLKLTSNKFSTLAQLEHLMGLSCLKNIDLENNEVAKLSNYKTHMFSLLPQLEVLDGYNKNGEEVESEESDYGAYGEEGEAELDADFLTEQLTDEQIEELKKRGISVEDFLSGKAGLDIDEEGEEDLYGDESDGDKEDPEDEADAKRQKTE